MKLGLNPDPLAAFRSSGYSSKILGQRNVAPPAKRKKVSRV
jgi:hypothetical protein